MYLKPYSNTEKAKAVLAFERAQELQTLLQLGGQKADTHRRTANHAEVSAIRIPQVGSKRLQLVSAFYLSELSLDFFMLLLGLPISEIARHEKMGKSGASNLSKNARV